MRINFTPQQLSAFLHLAATGSFSEAAQRQGVSQPALSRTIQQMEAMVGGRLFDRTTRKVALTPIGHELHRIAERLTAEFDSAASELARVVAGRSGRVTVAALPSIAAVLLPPAIAHFREGHPDVAVTILDGLSESVLEAVAQGRADLGLTIRPSPHATLTYRSLLADEFGLVCRADDDLAGEGPLPWSVFRNRPFIAMASTSSVRQMTDAAFLQAGLAIPPLFGCAFLGTTGNLVAAGLGITALPRLTLPLLGPCGLVWRRLEQPVMRRQMGIVTRTGRTLAPAALALHAALVLQGRRFEQRW
ncbi:LysR family transcriptional regulator [Methylobacterium isbiliense]|jgi:DNA-binding transcriptional LysR family regulator|uniref:HTH-type transcriptional regulator GltC n=1 Tax=Methylobacterium isbiliense TaxID=315478 RepID=A0ABQ4SMI4_9HYPH|nr:LysR family transcriptional regulator [Methylobacterium isbiliense]MDN3623674.1 LysR family transcriptional regulator [Methylobacterium isbiliense]GJE03098.1 HTH-type transcriptional regulator GltC [Methylobacterium isbiliense]